MMYRLPPRDDEWIDRTRSIAFTFEGKRYEGFAGDTITAALAAAGMMILGRSFKYHRPRGILSFANHDVNAMFQIGGVPNVRGDVTALEEGMNVLAVNTVGGLNNDRAQWLDRFARFLPVGFYYKAFNSKRFFPRWERIIRNMSGLGRVSFDAPHVRTPKRYAFCDVLVIGGGAAGASAALAAAEAGAKVLLVDENVRCASLDSRIEALTGSYVAAVYADRWVAVIEPQRMTKIRAGAIVFATGAIEQPIAFHNNDLPGILLTSGAQRLLQRHAVAIGRKVVVITTNRSGYQAAVDLLDAGIRVTHVIDLNETATGFDLVETRGVKVITGSQVLAAEAGEDQCVAAIHVGDKRIECDAVLMSGSWAPATQLLLQAGGKVAFDEASGMHLPAELPEGCFVAGRINGNFDEEKVRVEGDAAGRNAAAFAASPSPQPSLQGEGVSRKSPLRSSDPWPVARGPSPVLAASRGKDFVDFDEDLQVKDIENAIQEGFDSIELLKRYTTVGMGPSQGKHSNLNAARILANKRGLTLNDVGLTTARPMYHPVPMKHLAGRGFTPERATPIEQRHNDAGAVWMLAGNWHRPEYYARADEPREQSIAGEVAAVRNTVGLIDVGTLGKIEVHGPDAGAFLDRAYAGRYSDLKVGMTRYGLLLDESGTIVDDGVIARLHEQCYYFTTTTGGSAGVYRELLRLNALWGLNCSLVNVTGHRTAFNLAGPRSRELLSAMTSVNLNEGAFPYLGVREGIVGGASARLLRVGFVGELGYEIHVPFSTAAQVWDLLLDYGRKFDLRLFGVEAQRVLRLEKGHFIIGQDTDGLTNPFEVRAAWAVRKQKPFFVGQRSLKMLEQRAPRQVLVGFEIATAVPALKECHLAIQNGEIAGRITSVTYSHMLGKTIGLAMVQLALADMGSKLTFRMSDGSTVGATVCPTPFYDRDNQRQKSEVAA